MCEYIIEKQYSGVNWNFKMFNQTTSLDTKDKTRYSNFAAEDLDTTLCLIDQEIKESPRKTQKLVVDFLVSKQMP